MSREATPLRQILLAYALLISLLAAAWFAAGQPLLAKLARGETRIAALEVRVDALAKAAARDIALHPNAAREQLERMRGFIRRTTVDAETLEVGGSLLQRRLMGIIEEHGGEPGNTRVATDSVAESMTVSAGFTADLPGVTGILFKLARARPLMFVDLVSIRRRDHYLQVDQADKGELVVQIDVSAFWRQHPAE